MGTFKGKIHWFDARKKYGYVTDGYGNEYFFHQNGITKGRQIVTQGFESDDEVEFDLVDGEKGKMATNLTIIGDVKPKHVKVNNKKKGHGSSTGDTQMSKALQKAGINVTDKVEVPDVPQEEKPAE